MEKYYLIKDVSKITGLAPSNIRYYESINLIRTVKRNQSGIRYFTNKDITWIEFLRKLKDMEMPISQMKVYGRLREEGSSTIDQRIKILEDHKVFIKNKIKKLYINMALLEDKINRYEAMKEEIK